MLLRIFKVNKFLGWKLFCMKGDQVLKTYLEIIPPKKIYEIVKQQQNYLQDVITNQRELNLKHIEKYIKKRRNLIAINDFTKLMENIVERQNVDQYKSLLNLIFKSVKGRAQNASLQELIQFIYKLAKQNIKQPQLMKQVEDAIIQQKIKILYPLIRKILWTYTHLDLGTPTLYAHICKTIKIGQYQIQPLQLCQAAYLLSKVSENAMGGYGIFLIAEQHLTANLPRLDFHKLVEAASYMLTQNLGSNNFQIKLQQQLYRKYPTSDKLKPRDLVSLLKSTSGYYFKYKEGALLYMLKASTAKMVTSVTLQNFQDVLWSWGRSGKADQDLWTKLFEQVRKRINLLKVRQIVFFYYSLCSATNPNIQVLQSLQKKFLQLKLQEVNQHFLVKMLLGSHRRKDLSNEMFQKISTIILKKIQSLSNKQFILFVKILNQSDIDYTNKSNFKQIEKGLIKIGQKLIIRSYCLNVSQIIQICYLWIKLQIKNNLIDQLLKLIDKISQIPKPSFIKAMFIYVMKDSYLNVIQMLDVLIKLQKYGPIGYFFSPYQFPLLGYCLFHMAVKVKGNFKIPNKLLLETQEYMMQLNPIILNQFIKKGYNQGLKLIKQYHQK